MHFSGFRNNTSIVVTTYFFKKSPCGADKEGEKRDLASLQGLVDRLFYFIFDDYNMTGCEDASESI
jgi:hypothetical protein